MKSKKTSISSNPRVKVIDERDQIWHFIDNLTAGMTPDERYEKLKEISESIPTVDKSVNPAFIANRKTIKKLPK